MRYYSCIGIAQNFLSTFRVVESKCSEFPGGAFIYGLFGWRSRTLVKPKDFSKTNLFILPDFHGHPLSLAVGFLGMPGNTAYFGMLEICKPKPGETVVISTAAGSVGLIAGQIAKLKGCKVVGFTGSEDKRQLLLDKYGFDKAINYKNGDMVKALKEAAPEGVDCYFDNVGGELSAIIINQMNQFGRIACSGAVSEYNLDEPIKLPSMQVQFIFKQLTMEGFVVYRWAERWMEAINQNLEWIKEGKIKYDETITEGFENMPQAFIDVMRGKNMGKAVLKV